MINYGLLVAYLRITQFIVLRYDEDYLCNYCF